MANTNILMQTDGGKGYTPKRTLTVTKITKATVANGDTLTLKDACGVKTLTGVITVDATADGTLTFKATKVNPNGALGNETVPVKAGINELRLQKPDAFFTKDGDIEVTAGFAGSIYMSGVHAGIKDPQ